MVNEYETVALDCQQDGRSSGWYAVWEALGLLVGLPISNGSDFVQTPAWRVRELLTFAYHSYVAGDGGLQRWSLDAMFPRWDVDLPWSEAEVEPHAVVSSPPVLMSPSSAGLTFHPGMPPSSHRKQSITFVTAKGVFVWKG